MSAGASTDVAARGGSERPKVAVCSADMSTRGARIKRERERRRMPDGKRMSQLDLHKITGVGQRTIGRIEAGQAENSPSLTALEDYFGISDDSVPTDTHEGPRPHDEEAPPSLGRVMELLAEAMRLVAQLDTRGRVPVNGEPRRVRWPASEAPSAQRKQGPNHPEHSRGAQ